MIRALFVVAAGLTGIGFGQVLRQPERYPGSTAQTELQNDAVEVFRIRLAPRERIPMHKVTERVVVWMTDAHLRDTLADGTVHEVRTKAGQVEWVPAQMHAGENLDDRPVEFLAIVPKAGTHGRTPEVTNR